MATVRSLILMLIIILSTSACKKNTNDIPNPLPEQSGQLHFEGKNYNIAHGELLRFALLDSLGSYACPIYLLSSEYDFGDSTVTGTGQAAEIVLISQSGHQIASGTYEFMTEDSLFTGGFLFGLFHNWDLSNWHVDAFYQAKSGNIKVEIDGDYYKLTVNVLADKYDIGIAGIPPSGIPLATDITISCTYRGKLHQKYFS